MDVFYFKSRPFLHWINEDGAPVVKSCEVTDIDVNATVPLLLQLFYKEVCGSTSARAPCHDQFVGGSRIRYG